MTYYNKYVSNSLLIRTHEITISLYIHTLLIKSWDDTISKDQLKKVTGLQHLAENIFGNLNYQNLSTYQQINGAGISAGAANISINARARTTPARVCSAPPRSAALGWSLLLKKILTLHNFVLLWYTVGVGGENHIQDGNHQNQMWPAHSCFLN